MQTFKIIMTDDAVEDLIEVKNYIADVLLAPDVALSYVRAVRKEIEKLETLPKKFKLVDDEPWHTRGIRKFMVKNFYVYYRVDEEFQNVYILNIIYAKRNQLRVIKDMRID